MKRMPKVKDVMTAFAFSIAETATMSDAKDMMKTHKISHLPVKFADGRLGVLSQQAFQKAALPGHSHTEFYELTVGDLCPDHTYTVDLQTSLIEVLDDLGSGQHDCVLVTRHDKLAGVFTVSDACLAYSQSLKDEFFPEGGNSVA